MAAKNVVAKVGRKLEERVKHTVLEFLLAAVPVALGQIERQILHTKDHRVLAGRCQTGVRHRLDDGFDRELIGKHAAQHCGVGILEAILGAAQDGVASMLRAGVGVRKADVLRQFVDQEVQSRHRSAHVNPGDLLAEIMFERPWRYELAKSALRIGIGHHRLGTELATVGEFHTLSLAAADDDLCNRRTGQKLGAMGPRTLCQRICDRAHATLGKCPAAEGLLEFARSMVAEQIARTRRRWPTPDRDNPKERIEAADLLGLEVARQQIACGAEQEFVEKVLFAGVFEMLDHLGARWRIGQRPMGCQITKAAQARTETQQALGFLRRDLFKLLQGFVDVLPDEDMRGVIKQGKALRVRCVEFEAKTAGQLEIGNNLWTQHAGDKAAG